MTWQVLSPHRCELGESPFWHPHERRLYWVDIVARKIHRFKPSTGLAEHWLMPSEPGCIAPAALHASTPAQPLHSDGALVMALRDGVYRAAHWGGSLTLLAPAQHDTATHRFNDGRADPLGRFWVSTINEARTAASAQLFSLAPGAPQLQLMASGATVGNGLAWSPDANTLYWADTSGHVVRAWQWQARANVLASERVFKQWPAKPGGWQSAQGAAAYAGRPDGAAVDVDGNYYIAMYEGAQVLKLSPAGVVLASLAVPAQCPTMVCFGGDDQRTLYLTTARHNRPASELLALPASGAVLAMRMDVAGLPVNFCAA